VHQTSSTAPETKLVPDESLPFSEKEFLHIFSSEGIVAGKGSASETGERTSISSSCVHREVVQENQLAGGSIEKGKQRYDKREDLRPAEPPGGGAPNGIEKYEKGKTYIRGGGTPVGAVKGRAPA